MTSSPRAAVNAWLSRGQIQLLGSDGHITQQPAEYVAYFRRGADAPLSHHAIRQCAVEGDWIRAVCTPAQWDHALGRMDDPRRDLVGAFEADVHPIRRFVADSGINIARPRRVYLDIETDSRVRVIDAKDGRARVLCWALVGDDGVTRTGLLRADTDEDELRLLAELWSALESYDQVVAWNGDGFDFPVIKLRSGRSRQLKIDPRRWLWLDHMQAFKRYNIMSAESGEEKQSFALNSIAMSVTGQGKHDFDSKHTYEAWLADPQRLLDYCVQDTRLMPLIEAKTGYLELFQTICEVCKIFPDSRSLKPTKQVDGFMLRLGVEHGVHFPSVWYTDAEDPDPFQGAYVMEPRCRGITRDVHVADFASLYPSIMCSWNLSPEVKLPPGSTEGCLSPLTGVRTRIDVKGLITLALESLLALRAVWSKKRAALPPGTPEAKEAERRTNAYKQIANGFYGCCGNIHSRFYDREISESTTLNGQWLIKKTIEAAASRGWATVAGDTDSVFVMGCTDDEFREFVAWCNKDMYPSEMTAVGCTINTIKLTYEKKFAWIVFCAKKRYIGTYAHYKGTPAAADSAPEIKGLEYKRGDASRIAREFQKHVIDDLVAGHHDAEHYMPMIQSYLDRVLYQPLPLEDVVLSKSLSQEPEEYAAAMSHVKVAELLRERGEDVMVGDRVGYVVVDASVSPMRVIPAQDYVGTCDRYYLWSRVAKPSIRLLEAAFPDHTRWSKWLKVRPKSAKRGGPGEGQLGLF